MEDKQYSQLGREESKTRSQAEEVSSPHNTTSSMVPAMTNYNVNVQFDPAIPQAGKPTHLNLIVTEQKLGEPIKQFDTYMTNSCT
jgi:hypothetical protein